MAEHERPHLDKGYEKYWKAVLPSASKGELIAEITPGPTVILDGQPDNRPKSLAPTQYTEFMRNGKAAWWMVIAGPTITIGCTQYGGWKSTRRKAYELFSNVGRTLGSAHPLGQIQNAELTYQDLLIWEGNTDDYDPRLAIQEEWIPKQVGTAKEWHTGQGWVEDTERARILERFRIGAEVRKRGSQPLSVIQVVTTAIWGFGGATRPLRLERAFGHIQSADGSDDDGRQVYDELHDRVHALFGGLITEGIARRIGLTQPGDFT